MKANELVEGNNYQLKRQVEQMQEGDVVTFKYLSGDDVAIIHPVGEPDMQSCVGVNPELYLDALVSLEYHLTVSSTQMATLLKALDIYSRIGMYQLEIVAETIHDQYDFPRQTIDTLQNALKTAKMVLGQPANGHLGIAGPQTAQVFQIAYDLQSVFQQVVAKHQNVRSGDVRHNNPLHLVKTVPLAKVEVIVP